MFVASLTPVGWAVDIAQILQLIGQLSNDEEFKEALQSIVDQPLEELKELKTKLSESLDPAQIVSNLLLGGYDLSKFAPPPQKNKPKERKPRRRSRFAALQRGTQNIKKLYRVFGMQMQLAHDKVQVPVSGARANLLRHTRLARTRTIRRKQLGSLSIGQLCGPHPSRPHCSANLRSRHAVSTAQER